MPDHGPATLPQPTAKHTIMAGPYPVFHSRHPSIQPYKKQPSPVSPPGRSCHPSPSLSGPLPRLPLPPPAPNTNTNSVSLTVSCTPNAVAGDHSYVAQCGHLHFPSQISHALTNQQVMNYGKLIINGVFNPQSPGTWYLH
ncbi:hypothetical protein CROQUDRAFT_86813 [Cronartium quercuum f. sp. fusiforme G11]|uniref:Uncharacterized protein n=1 Tax=Cronartium quercuum f. sp. fusiforme G11 TaxID=708437 RepID=A0A9P6NSX9_9BASI|nr:hypothetical protein CROQUDRAFT_86813 [Cronartium quercuum f. sp. fusiforme G11]